MNISLRNLLMCYKYVKNAHICLILLVNNTEDYMQKDVKRIFLTIIFNIIFETARKMLLKIRPFPISPPGISPSEYFRKILTPWN